MLETEYDVVVQSASGKSRKRRFTARNEQRACELALKGLPRDWRACPPVEVGSASIVRRQAMAN